jgi:hypothetical protein
VAVRVDPEALVSQARGLAGSQTVPLDPVVAAPAADPVTLGAVAALQAHVAALATVVGHSGALRAHGGAAVAQTAAFLRGVDDHNAATIGAVIPQGAIAPAGGAGGPGAAGVGMPPPAPVVPPIPAPPVVAPLTGEQWSQLLYGGPGSAGLREFGAALESHAYALETLADQVKGYGRGIEEHWVDGSQQAGANTIRHSQWLYDSAARTRTIAASAHTVADAFDAAKHATPSPGEFAQARRDIMAAQAARNPAALLQATRRFADLQAQALDAALNGYQPRASTTTNSLGEPLPPAPPITHANGTIQTVDNHTFKRDPPPPPAPPVNPFAGWTDEQKRQVAIEIAHGHVLDNHGGDFPKGWTEPDIARWIYDSMNDPNTRFGTDIDSGALTALRDGRIIRIQPKSGDWGSAFKPEPLPGSKWHTPEEFFDQYTKAPEPLAPPTPGRFPPVHPEEMSPKVPAPVPPPAPEPAPPAEAPAPKPAAPPKGGFLPGGPGTPLEPRLVHPPHSIPHHFPILGEDDPGESPRDFE